MIPKSPPSRSSAAPIADQLEGEDTSRIGEPRPSAWSCKACGAPALGRRFSPTGAPTIVCAGSGPGSLTHAWPDDEASPSIPNIVSVNPMAMVHFHETYVVTTPNGARIEIPAGSTAQNSAALPPGWQVFPGGFAGFSHGPVDPHPPAPARFATGEVGFNAYGEVGFNAYGEHGPAPWMTFDGRPMPRWPELEATPAGQLTRARWAAAASAEIVAFLERLGYSHVPAVDGEPERLVKL